VLRVSRQASGEPEIFVSVQGEGVSLGRPSIFVRLAVCNLRCSWCDTSYTWDWDRYDPAQEILEMTADEVRGRVESVQPRNVVFTGGEPLLQQRDLGPLFRALKESGHRLEVETNGTIQPNADLADTVDQWNVSPKLANSANPTHKREVPEPLRWFAAQPTAHFKFVVSAAPDLDELNNLVERYGIPSERVLVMPEGTSADRMGTRSLWLVDRCIEHGYRFTTRLHVLLWGDERGR
jgi:7-cyano-7-deazaguanosine (preQ0) biosynthesis protein QueE